MAPRHSTVQITPHGMAGRIRRDHLGSADREVVFEPAPLQDTGEEFYMPHRVVNRSMRHDNRLSRAWSSLAPQNKIYDVLVCGRFHSVALAGNTCEAFLQVRIREGERDTLRLHWMRDLHSTQVQVFRFTRALFGLAPSP